MIEFAKWPSIPRLFRDCIVTEKIDGTNAAVGIAPLESVLIRNVTGDMYPDGLTSVLPTSEGQYAVWAQSRKQIITPEADNFGFAKWVAQNAIDLVAILRDGLHFGEWWGSGIQRGYGLPKGEKRFSLFNTKRWADLEEGTPDLDGLYCVPVLYQGSFEGFMQGDLDKISSNLREYGSVASPGFMRPEGVVIYHNAANHCFKYTPFDGDGHKGAQ